MLDDEHGRNKLDAWGNAWVAGELVSGEASNCPTFPVDSCLSTSLATLRGASLACLDQLDFPLVNNPNWGEYVEGGKCATMMMDDGTATAVTLVEPRNALSNSAYDHLTCRTNSPGLHTSATLLGFGSFAFHAKGSNQTARENKVLQTMDAVGMGCVTLSIFRDALMRTGTSTTISLSDTAGQARSYDLDAIQQEFCETSLPQAYTTCASEDALNAALNAAKEAVPDYKAMITMMLSASMHHCYGGTVAALLSQLSNMMMNSNKTVVQPDQVAFANFRFANPRTLTTQDYTDEGGFCRNINWFILNFVCGVAVQGEIVTAGLLAPEDHAQWHARSAEAVNHAAIAIETL